jgi:hypothetical protein
VTARLPVTMLAAAMASGAMAGPTPALACAVCFVGSADTVPAFVGTAVALSVLPFILMGGLALWLRRRLRAVPPAE